jgi:LuxR family maltose regulon positive regulatory protein
MTSRIPRVEDGVMRPVAADHPGVAPDDAPGDPPAVDPIDAATITVGTPAWFTWLADPATRSFAFRHPAGVFTARKERRQRGEDYWVAYRMRTGRLRKFYLGKSPELTSERLRGAAVALAPGVIAPAPVSAGGEDRARGDASASASASDSAARGPRQATAATRPLATQDAHEAFVLLSTKLAAPPPRPRLIPRTRLTDQLTRDLEQPLVLVTAPAGFGKTTLLSEWRATRVGSEFPLAWVSLDESDNDPVQFWTYVTAALRAVMPDLSARDVLAPLRSPQPAPLQAVVATLVNALAALATDAALVLDDYHVIATPAIHTSLTYFIEHLPPRMHVVLTSRVGVPLPLPRLRARGRVAELHAADLRCTDEEAAIFLQQVMGLRLDDAGVALLAERTEGWLAGLQLAALALRGREEIPTAVAASISAPRYVEPYLVEEVLRRQPEAIQRFLLRTSILDDLSGPLCDAVTGGADGEAMLRALDHSNLFVIPLDDTGRWYRYHHLFAEVLRARLHATAPGSERDLHRRASGWYAAQGRPTDAVRHALAGGDVERAAVLIEEVALPLIWQRGEVATVEGWLAALPESIGATRPRLGIAHALACVLSWRHEAAERVVAAVAPIVEGEHGTPEQRGQLAALRAYLVRQHGDIAGCIALARQALDLLPEDGHEWRSLATIILAAAHLERGELAAADEVYAAAVPLGRRAGNQFMTVLSLGEWALVEFEGGQLRQAAARCREAIREAGGPGHLALSPAAGFAYLLLGLVLYEWDDLDQALECAEACITLYQRIGHGGNLVYSYDLLMRVQRARGNTAAARAACEAAMDLGRERREDRFFAGTLDMVLARWSIQQGDIAAAALWRPAFRAGDDPDLPGFEADPMTVEYEQLTLARLWLAERRYDDALEIVRPRREAAAEAGRQNVLLEMLTLEALAWQGKGKSDRGMAALGRALELAAPEGYVRAFVDLGDPLARLLRLAAVRGVSASYVRSLLDTFDLPRRPDDLTDQELRVLARVAAGASNQAIAEQLVIAPSTVKTHLQHIFNKLGVRSRTEAIARARERHLL